PLARGAADQIVDRQSGALAENVPRGDLDRTPRRRQLGRTALDCKIFVHYLAGVPDIKGAAADQVWRHCPDALGDNLFLALRHIGLAPAMEPVLGFDAAEQQVLRAAGAENKGFDPRNLHGWSPAAEHSRSGSLDPHFRGCNPIAQALQSSPPRKRGP